MRLKILYKHIKHSDSVEEKIKKKVSKLSKYVWKDLSVKWTCSSVNNENITEVDVYDGNYHFYSKASNDNLYKSFDLAMEKLDKQLLKSKEKIKNKMHNKKSDLEVLDPEDAWIVHDENKFDDV